MKRTLIGDLLASLCIVSAFAGTAALACGPATDGSVGVNAAATARYSASLTSDTGAPLARFDSGPVPTLALSSGSGPSVHARRQPPPCGCVPTPFKNCLDRFCNPA